MNTVLLSVSHDDTYMATEISEALTQQETSFLLDLDGLSLQASLGSGAKAAFDNYQISIVLLSEASLSSYWLPLTVAYTIGAGKKILTFSPSQIEELPLYVRNLPNVDSIEGLNGELEQILADTKRTRTVTLNKRFTENLIRLHVASTAKNVTEIMDNYLEDTRRNPGSFNVDNLFRDVEAALLKSRDLLDGFESRELGDLKQYFSEKFTSEQLFEHVESAGEKLQQATDASYIRAFLKRQLSSVQEKLVIEVLEDMRSS